MAAFALNCARVRGGSGMPLASALPPYGHVLLDLLSGDSTFSVRGDGAEEAWRVVAPVLAAWADGRVPLDEYPAGSDGPPPLTGARVPECSGGRRSADGGQGAS